MRPGLQVAGICLSVAAMMAAGCGGAPPKPSHSPDKDNGAGGTGSFPEKPCPDSASPILETVLPVRPDTDSLESEIRQLKTEVERLREENSRYKTLILELENIR